MRPENDLDLAAWVGNEETEPCEDCGAWTARRVSALTNSGRVIWVPLCGSCEPTEEE